MVVSVASHDTSKTIRIALNDQSQFFSSRSRKLHRFGAIAILVSTAPIVLCKSRILGYGDSTEEVLEALCWHHGIQLLGT